jgi:RNA polymerase sigma-32 factor
MAKITIALEAAVASVIENKPKEGERQTTRQRSEVDKAFATILKLIAPRIRHFIRQYGLISYWEDAEQCCAIGVHRAIEAYDPTKAQFTTFVNWQLRGELQGLRYRLMTDQRQSAKKVQAITVSLQGATAGGHEGAETSLEDMIEDENALERTETGASDYLARRSTAALIEEYVRQNRTAGLEQLHKRPQPKRGLRQLIEAESSSSRLDPVELEKLEDKLAREREILERRVFNDAPLDEVEAGVGIPKEQIRHISKRATKGLAKLASTKPRFAIMAEYGAAAAKPVKTKPARLQVSAPAQIVAETTVSLLPVPTHNHALRIVAVEAHEPSSVTSRTAGSRIDPAFTSKFRRLQDSIAA